MNKHKINIIKSWRDYIMSLIENITPEVATFVACQFALESNFGESNLAKNHNNVSGMKKALVRPTTSRKIDGLSDFAHYADFKDCVYDYFLCLAFHRLEWRDLSSVNSFSCAIKNWYCPERGYIDKINTIYSQFNQSNHEQTK